MIVVFKKRKTIYDANSIELSEKENSKCIIIRYGYNKATIISKSDLNKIKGIRYFETKERRFVIDSSITVDEFYEFIQKYIIENGKLILPFM